MAAVAIPIQKIQSAGQFGASLRSNPFWNRRLLMFYHFPTILRFTNRSLAGDRLGRLTAEQANLLYDALQPLYVELVGVVESFSSHPWYIRFLLGWWQSKVAAETEELGDVLETLAWGSDPELRGCIESSLAAIQELSPQLCQRT